MPTATESIVQKFLASWEKVDRFFAGFCFFAMSALIIVDVGLREITHQSSPTFQKWAMVFMIWSGFVGAILTSARGGHLRPEMADKLWGKKIKPWIDRLSQFFVAAFCFFMAYVSTQYVVQTKEFGDMHVVLQIPMWLIQVVIPYTFIAMGIRHIVVSMLPKLKPSTEATQS